MRHPYPHRENRQKCVRVCGGGVCVLFEVVEDGPKVEAKERVRLVGVVKKFLYLEVQGGPFKQTAGLPGQHQRKEKKKNQKKERNQSRDI